VVSTLRNADWSELEQHKRPRHDAGVLSVLDTAVNPAGMTVAKSVPLSRLEVFHRPGLRAAGRWPVFWIDTAIAGPPGIDATGDLRLNLYIDALHDLCGGLA